MSAYSTSSPSIEQTRWYLIRPPSLACTCRNDTSCDSVAAYSFTGTLTSPNETAPFQIARMPTLLLCPAPQPGCDQCDRCDGQNPSVRRWTASARMGPCAPCSPPPVPTCRP